MANENTQEALPETPTRYAYKYRYAGSEDDYEVSVMGVGTRDENGNIIVTVNEENGNHTYTINPDGYLIEETRKNGYDKRDGQGYLTERYDELSNGNTSYQFYNKGKEYKSEHTSRNDGTVTTYEVDEEHRIVHMAKKDAHSDTLEEERIAYDDEHHLATVSTYNPGGQPPYTVEIRRMQEEGTYPTGEVLSKGTGNSLEEAQTDCVEHTPPEYRFEPPKFDPYMADLNKYENPSVLQAITSKARVKFIEAQPGEDGTMVYEDNADRFEYKDGKVARVIRTTKNGTATYEFDKHGHVQTVTIRDNNGMLKSESKYEYNGAGGVVSRTETTWDMEKQRVKELKTDKTGTHGTGVADDPNHPAKLRGREESARQGQKQEEKARKTPQKQREQKPPKQQKKKIPKRLKEFKINPPKGGSEKQYDKKTGDPIWVSKNGNQTWQREETTDAGKITTQTEYAEDEHGQLTDMPVWEKKTIKEKGEKEKYEVTFYDPPGTMRKTMFDPPKDGRYVEEEYDPETNSVTKRTEAEHYVEGKGTVVVTEEFDPVTKKVIGVTTTNTQTKEVEHVDYRANPPIVTVRKKAGPLPEDVAKRVPVSSNGTMAGFEQVEIKQDGRLVGMQYYRPGAEEPVVEVVYDEAERPLEYRNLETHESRYRRIATDDKKPEKSAPKAPEQGVDAPQVADSKPSSKTGKKKDERKSASRTPAPPPLQGGKSAPQVAETTPSQNPNPNANANLLSTLGKNSEAPSPTPSRPTPSRQTPPNRGRT